jgi:hypothetical protein
MNTIPERPLLLGVETFVETVEPGGDPAEDAHALRLLEQALDEHRNGDLIVVLAGPDQPLGRLLASVPGLASRVPHIVTLRRYTAAELSVWRFSRIVSSVSPQPLRSLIALSLVPGPQGASSSRPDQRQPVPGRPSATAGTVSRHPGAGALAGWSYRDNGLLRLVIDPQRFRGGMLDWRVAVCAEALQPPKGAYWATFAPVPGATAADRQEPRRNFTGYAWPVTGAGLDPRLVSDVGRFAEPMLWFPANARDLGELMLQRTGLTRGDVHAQVTGAPAARAVGAVMLARGAARPELEEAARSLVASREDRGRDVTYWAGAERDWSPVDISDLEEIPDIPKYSPEEIRREFARYFPDDAANS